MLLAAHHLFLFSYSFLGRGRNRIIHRTSMTAKSLPMLATALPRQVPNGSWSMRLHDVYAWNLIKIHFETVKCCAVCSYACVGLPPLVLLRFMASHRWEEEQVWSGFEELFCITRHRFPRPPMFTYPSWGSDILYLGSGILQQESDIIRVEQCKEHN